MRKAVVRDVDGYVENVILADDNFPAPEGCTLFSADGAAVGPGDWRLNGVFVSAHLADLTASPNPAVVDEMVTITAVLPAGSPDAEVMIQVEDGQEYTEPVEDGQASHLYAFDLPGTYRVTVSSAHHREQVVEVTVT